MEGKEGTVYLDIMPLGHRSDVSLVQEMATGRLVVRRVTSKNLKTLYETPMLPEELAVNYISQLCEVLTIVHRKGLIHRDIKPSNVMVKADGKVVLIDFDIARFHRVSQTADTALLGTQGYASPEQFGFSQTDFRSDIYAVGALLNKLLTDKLPQEKLPEGSIRHIVTRCVDVDPIRRYQSALALRRVLRPYLPRENAPLVRILRRAPGFRTWTLPNMVIAVLAYTLVAASVLHAVIQDWEILSPKPVISVAAAFGLYGLLFCYIFNCFRIRSRIPWLEKVRGQAKYAFRCIVFGLFGLLTVSVIVSILLMWMWS